MKQTLVQIIENALATAEEKGELTAMDQENTQPVHLERPKQSSHGDWSTNVAMTMAKSQKMAPRKIAEILLPYLSDPEGVVEKTEIAGPGFINFHLRQGAWFDVLAAIHEKGERFGESGLGENQRVQVEFVSANPTGPLHVGHGRGAALGDALARVLAFAGYDVQKEYYINDSGRQIRTLGLSVYLRFQEQQGRQIEFPADCYQGEYIEDMARRIKEENLADLASMEEDEAVLWCARFAAKQILGGIRADLEQFRVRHDEWFSEQSLYDQGAVDAAMEDLKGRGLVYEKDGAWWFKTEEYGDEKDRVVIRANGLTTYFASDIAYHKNKFDRGFEKVIDIWGADHHGYVNRVKAAVQAMGNDPDSLGVILVKLVNLLRAGEPVAMSTRSGEFVTLKEVIDEVGADAARFIFLSRHHESPLDFDLELAKQQTNENPVFYVQYAHARVTSIARKADAEPKTMAYDPAFGKKLVEPEETELAKKLAQFPEAAQYAAKNAEPHRIAYYLLELAGLFHPYYNKHRVIVDDEELTRARLCLILAVQRVLKNGLGLLGVSAPNEM